MKNNITASERAQAYLKAAKIHSKKYNGLYHEIPPPLTKYGEKMREIERVLPELKLFRPPKQWQANLGLQSALELVQIQVLALLFCAEIAA